jgi:hypothetical protein
LIDADLAMKIGLEGEVCPLRMKWTGNVTRLDDHSKKVKLEICGGLSNDNIYHCLNARTISDLELCEQPFDFTTMSEQYPYIRNATLKRTGRPMLLIGQDNCQIITSSEIIHPEPTAPMMSRTKIGWVVHGPIHGERPEETHINICCHENGSELHEIVNIFKILDNIGIALPKIDRNKSEEDCLALRIANENIADGARRHNNDINFSCSSRWFQGPPFSKTDENTWCSQLSLGAGIDQEEGMKDIYLPGAGIDLATEIALSHVGAGIDLHDEDERDVQIFNLVEEDNIVLAHPNKFSSLLKLKRSAAWMNRFILKTQKLTRNDCKTEIHELTWKLQLKQIRKLIGLNPFLDDECVLQIGGRLKNADLPDDTHGDDGLVGVVDIQTSCGVSKLARTNVEVCVDSGNQHRGENEATQVNIICKSTSKNHHEII